MLSTYYTVNKQGTDEITIQKSRFIANVKRVESEEEAQEFIQSIKKEHRDATHNCSAYIIGETDYIQKANDDGEPSGTAGVPMLEVLKKKGLKDTAVVVTRYFGGIKLGAGGLIRAYGSATTQGIQTTGIVRRELMQGVSVTVEYTLLGKLENEIRQQSKYLLEDIHYLENVAFIIYVKTEETDIFQDWITEMTNAQAAFELLGQKYVDIDVEDTPS
ncbi:YigZ family protein [Oceanobacillus oncorhynchi]|uniref:YigZ family protein n=1 Tax=Oceanobacillus oncorhynchi TaxID=545501 RepID=UPI00186653C5|nr:YigZ family protein [Oceanobacillus oncorhynchi]MDM8098785.1 YigZ family protein [Oceanobacillus oncorhynchi]